MSTINSQIISDAKTLAFDLQQFQDPFEKELDRASKRGTAAIWSVFISVLIAGPFGFPIVLYANDADIDGLKLKKIEAKQLELSNTKIEPDSPDATVEKATFAKEFQMKAYKEIKKYTENAQRIKLITTAAALSCLCTSLIVILRRSESLIDAGLTLAFNAGLVTGTVSALYGLIHTINAGTELQKKNKTVAEIALNYL